MKQKTSVLLTLTSLVLTLFLSFNLQTSYAAADDKVTICHATGSQSNPYNQIIVSENAIGGHFDNPGSPKSGHETDLFFYGEVACSGGEVNIPTNVPTPTQPQVPECEWEFCPIATPTSMPTPTSTGGALIEGNINIPLCQIFRTCPTQTPVPTMQPTVTPTQGPTSTPQPSSGGGNTGGGGGSSSGSSSSSSTGGTVLGTATTLAATGTFTDTLFNAIATLGVLTLGLATVQYGKEKGK